MNPLSGYPWRIAHTESSLGWGGQERRILAEMQGFRQHGSSTWLLAPTDAKIHQRARALGMQVLNLSTSKIRFPYTVLELALWLRRERIQILNPHSSRDSWVAGLAGRIAKVPFVMRSRHFDIPIRQPLVSRIVYTQLSHRILTTSPKITQNLTDLFHLTPDRITTLPTGIDLTIYHPEGPKAPLPDSVPKSGVPIIGMIGVFRRAKGHPILLEAIAILKKQGFKAHFVIVGEGPMMEATQQKAAELGLQSEVTFTGEREDVPDILRTLNLLVMPSIHEGIPQVGLQALATKTPVVGSDVGGIAAIFRPGKTGRLVPPENPPKLAEAIRDVFDQPELTAQLAEGGRRLVEEEHSFDTMLRQLEAIYLRYLPQHRPTRGHREPGT